MEWLAYEREFWFSLHARPRTEGKFGKRPLDGKWAWIWAKLGSFGLSPNTRIEDDNMFDVMKNKAHHN